MRTNHTFGVQFILRKNKAKKGVAPIYIRITVDTKRVEISLKQNIPISSWDGAKGKAKGSLPEAKRLNLHIDKVKARIVECYQELVEKQEIVTAGLLKDKYLGIGSEGHTIGELFEYHKQQEESTLSKSTMDHYCSMQVKLKLFIKQKYHTNDIPVRKINYQFVSEFDHFLRSLRRMDGKALMKNNSVTKYLKSFKKVIGIGMKLKWVTENPFSDIKFKLEKKERCFLDESEILAIENFIPRKEKHSLVKDLFLFSCYTGLAYCDVIELCPDNINIGIDGERWIFTKRQKTGNPVKIPVLPKAQAIIQKYINNPQSENRERIFPFIGNDWLNVKLHEITKQCGIQKHVSFHIARHSFATTMTLTNGVPIETVSKLLGHSSISTTQIYAKVVESKISEDMRALRINLENKNNKELIFKASNE